MGDEMTYRNNGRPSVARAAARLPSRRSRAVNVESRSNSLSAPLERERHAQEVELRRSIPRWMGYGHCGLAEGDGSICHMNVQLRAATEGDVPVFFRHYLQSITGGDGEAAFCGRWHRMLKDPHFLIQTITVDNEIAGYVAHFVQCETPSISYWLDEQLWGRGIATAALQLFLEMIAERPLYARAATDNIASHRVLEKCGFEKVRSDSYLSKDRGAELEEIVFAIR